MKMNKKVLFFLLILAFGLVFILPAVSYAGRPIGGTVDKAKSAVDGVLGVRFASRLPENLHSGVTVQAIVLNPSKLAAYGFTSLKRGDRVTFIQGSEAGVFQVQQGAVLRRFKINDKGAVVPF